MAIDIYLPSVYFKNLKKYQGQYSALAKQRNECTDENKKKELHKEMQLAYKKKLSRGYYREGHNNFYLLERLGLDWNNYLPALTKDSNLPVGTVKLLRDAVAGATFIENFKPRPHPLAFLMRSAVLTDKQKLGLKKKFVLLCDESIKKNEPLHLKLIGAPPLSKEEIEKLKEENEL